MDRGISSSLGDGCMVNAYMNWSGGKDSSLCLYKALQLKQYS